LVVEIADFRYGQSAVPAVLYWVPSGQAIRGVDGRPVVRFSMTLASSGASRSNPRCRVPGAFQMPQIRMASLMAILAAGTLTVFADAQDQKPASGIFVEAADSQPGARLPSARFDIRETGVGKSMATMGLAKPQMEGTLTGPKADTRVAGDATFRFQFSGQSGNPSADMSLQSMMGMMNGGDGSIPSMAKGPQDLALIKLTPADENRQARFGTPGSSRAKDAVDVVAEKIGPNTYRVKPRHPLPPGEYAFYVRMGNAPAGQAWDFGVDGK
jgi:hypothetical protein